MKKLMSFAKPVTYFIFVFVTIQFAAFGITSIDILPCHTFHTLNDALEIVASIMLCLGTILISAKFVMVRKRKPKVSEGDYVNKYPDLIRLSFITQIFVFLASLCAGAVFIWSVCTRSVSGVNTGYLATISIFLCIVGVYTTVTRKRHSPPLMDYYLRTLYLSLYIQLSFREISETLQMYEGLGADCSSNGTVITTGHPWGLPDRSRGQNLTGIAIGDHSDHASSHGPSSASWWKETLEKAAYAFTTESMLLLLVYHIEKKETQLEIEENENEDTRDGERSCGRLEITAVASNLETDDSPDYSKPDWIIWIFGYLFIILAGVSLFQTSYIMKQQQRALPTREILIWQSVTFASMSAYIGVSFFAITAHLLTPADLAKVDDTPDVRLLFWSTQGSLLWVSLTFAAAIIGPIDPIFPFFCIQFVIHILQIWLQYSYIRHAVALKQLLEGTEGAYEKVHMHIIPLGLANALYWASNLGLWENVELLRFSTSHLPGPVWMVVGVSLFPIVLFYRFHSFIMCFLLFYPPTSPRRLFKFWFHRRRPVKQREDHEL